MLLRWVQQALEFGERVNQFAFVRQCATAFCPLAQPRQFCPERGELLGLTVEPIIIVAKPLVGFHKIRQHSISATDFVPLALRLLEPGFEGGIRMLKVFFGALHTEINPAKQATASIVHSYYAPTYASDLCVNADVERLHTNHFENGITIFL